MKPLPFSQTLAHLNDPLPEHLWRVAERARNAIAPSAQSELGLIAFVAGLFHDIGKATPYFQAYLLKTKRKTQYTPHAKMGAVLSWWYTGEMALPVWIRLAIFLAILRHHGHLNYESWKQHFIQIRRYDFKTGKPLLTQLSSLDLNGIHYWLQNLPQIEGLSLPKNLPPLTLEKIEKRLLEIGLSKLRQPFPDLEAAVIFVAGFGSLLAVDKIDAAMQGATIPRQALPSDAVTKYKRFLSSASNLNERREQIATEVKQTWLAHLDKHLFSLTAPTGSGKTLTILNAALAIRAEIEKTQGYSPRIIYCLPFMSVIDQNHGVFREVFKANNLFKKGERQDNLLLKHHHLVDGLYKTDHAEYEADGAGQLLTETWQSELVVTTFYQLLHSLLSYENGNLKRAGQLTGSLVLMDEVQAIPLKYWQALCHLFQAVANSLGTRFVLLTATKPLIFRSENAVELLPSHTEHFRALSRVEIHYQAKPLTLAQFSEQLIEKYRFDNRAMLIIVNQKRAVESVFTTFHQALPDRKIIALSTHFTPKDRRSRIRLIQLLLRQNQPCIVISTQLVEAGVDISFPIVHRDLAPLDSVIQSAGRCNRHNNSKVPGELHLWHLYDNGKMNTPLCQKVYDTPLIEVTEAIFSQQAQWQESDFLQLSEQYFEKCWLRHDQEEVEQWLKAGNFERIQTDFQLIREGAPKRSLFIVSKDKRNQEARQSELNLWQRYCEIVHDKNLSPQQQKQQFAEIRHPFYERVIQVEGKPERDEPITKIEAGKESYNRKIGFIKLKEESVCIF
jgi:CRISPR-associated endonuclease/helicase Cas3